MESVQKAEVQYVKSQKCGGHHGTGGADHRRCRGGVVERLV
jgi:hypothetical protein